MSLTGTSMFQEFRKHGNDSTIGHAGAAYLFKEMQGQTFTS
jgi:hypothetical protein